MGIIIGLWVSRKGKKDDKGWPHEPAGNIGSSEAGESRHFFRTAYPGMTPGGRLRQRAPLARRRQPRNLSFACPAGDQLNCANRKPDPLFFPSIAVPAAG